MDTDRCRNARGQKCHAKGNRKEIKYNLSCIAIKRMWNMKCMIIPATIKAIGIETKDLKKNLEGIPGKYSIDLVQKTAVL